jgi:hypothetical protein
MVMSMLLPDLKIVGEVVPEQHIWNGEATLKRCSFHSYCVACDRTGGKISITQPNARNLSSISLY